MKNYSMIHKCESNQLSVLQNKQIERYHVARHVRSSFGVGTKISIRYDNAYTKIRRLSAKLFRVDIIDARLKRVSHGFSVIMVSYDQFVAFLYSRFLDITPMLKIIKLIAKKKLDAYSLTRSVVCTTRRIENAVANAPFYRDEDRIFARSLRLYTRARKALIIDVNW